jgi:hypothetical protein
MIAESRVRIAIQAESLTRPTMRGSDDHPPCVFGFHFAPNNFTKAIHIETGNIVIPFPSQIDTYGSRRRRERSLQTLGL